MPIINVLFSFLFQFLNIYSYTFENYYVENIIRYLKYYFIIIPQLLNLLEKLEKSITMSVPIIIYFKLILEFAIKQIY